MSLDEYTCGHCGAGFGIAGEHTGSEDDYAADEYFTAQIDWHRSGACSPAAARVIRNDGRPARKPRLGIPAGSPPAAAATSTKTKAPNWHELVQAGPKGDPEKRQQRAARIRHGEVIEPRSIAHGRQQHGIPVRAWPWGGLVLHRRHARGSGGIDRSTLTPAAVRNRLARIERKRAARAAA
jgi:hypothetical protein